MSSHNVFPELVAGRSDQFVESGWRIEQGWALRGHASCDFLQRVLEVPFGASDADRLIRAHELMHLRVSPHDVNPLDIHPELPPRALECAEEFRVNELLRRLGFPVEHLFDGSEDVAAQRLAVNNAWDETVFFFVAIMSTGAEKGFLRGLRRVRPEWVKALGVVRRRVLSIMSALSTEEIASTSRDVENHEALPSGFVQTTVPLARVLMEIAQTRAPAGVDQLRQFRRSLEPGGRRAPTGRFAPLVFDLGIEFDTAGAGRSARHRKPATSGVALRYPNRLLTDPYQRGFVNRRASSGGLVVIDQSGSMDLDPLELDGLIRATPGVTVIGYSHRPGDVLHQPNCWVLAKPGHRATETPKGNVGNGVDGPALKWAISRRRPGERIIWITDGQVTDSNDHPCVELSRECAQLVLKHRIRLVRTLSDARADLMSRGSAPHEASSNFGRIGREIASN